MDLIFDLTEEEVEVLDKAFDILETISDEIETVSCKEEDFTEISIIERRTKECWYSLIERIIITSIGINTLLEEPIFDKNIQTERTVDN